MNRRFRVIISGAIVFFLNFHTMIPKSGYVWLKRSRSNHRVLRRWWQRLLLCPRNCWQQKISYPFFSALVSTSKVVLICGPTSLAVNSKSFLHHHSRSFINCHYVEVVRPMKIVVCRINKTEIRFGL